ncbi:hypothetical protein BGZ96_004043 [Linnemannia gamsii]|uniref:Uncharacterized protein n=1 Tax=Linnemannia gamsii TaxID=64522 RepID=A0ABQ7K7X1_9FUNG|nr:hypothetical protein BGZ96_004043 [Linnemannia gamsii]
MNEMLEVLEMGNIETDLQLKTLLTKAPALMTLTVNGFTRLWGSPPPVHVPEHAPETEFPAGAPVVRIRQLNGSSLASPQQQLWQQRGLISKAPVRRFGVPVVDSVSGLLSSLLRLRVLEIPREVVKAENILESPWVCLQLEEFWCQIVEVPFLTEEEELQVQQIRQREVTTDTSDQQHARTVKEDELMERSEKCVSTTKLIMAQLSKLTSLKYLSLSPDFRIGDDLFEHRLSAMYVYKSERDGRSYIRYDDYLSIESIDHRLDTADIEWIAKELPRLKEMRGLVKENFVRIEPDPKTDALVTLMRRLRTDVAQRQSFCGYSKAPVKTNFFGSGHIGGLIGSTMYGTRLYM